MPKARLPLPKKALPIAAMSNKPVVLFVHGSWHTPKHFEIVRAIFEKAGYETSCPRQPSVGNLPPVCLVDDAKRITHELEQLVEEKQKDVLVVAHSYGGMVANLGVEKRFAKAVCTEQGKAGGVVRIIYMAAFLVPIGQSLSSPLGGTLPPFIPVDVSAHSCFCCSASHRAVRHRYFVGCNMDEQCTDDGWIPGARNVYHAGSSNEVLP